MNKVYLVVTDNGESYEDRNEYNEKVFKSFRAASEYLINNEFKVHYTKSFMGEDELYFFYEYQHEYGYPVELHGWIEELDFINK